jgi:hypothetical protein
MTSYEQLRNDNIRRNQEYLDSLFPKGETLIPIVKLKNKKKAQEVVVDSILAAKRKSSRIIISNQDNNNVINEIHCTSSSLINSSSTEASSIIILNEKIDRIDAIKLRQYIESKNKEHSMLITDMVIPIIFFVFMIHKNNEFVLELASLHREIQRRNNSRSD